MPFVGIDMKHDVDLDSFNTANILALFPGIRVLGSPRCTHASMRHMSIFLITRKDGDIREEGSVSDCLNVGSGEVMILVGEVDVA